MIRKEIQKGKAPAGADATAVEELKSKILAAVHGQFAHIGFEPVFAAETVEPDIDPDIQIAVKPVINMAHIITAAENYERYLKTAVPTLYFSPEPKPTAKKK